MASFSPELAGFFCGDFMAVENAVENEYGAQFTYHKLREVRIVNDDKIGVQLTLTVQSWLDKPARISGKQPTTRQCIIMAADFAMTPFYALLKAKFPEFTSGADDFDNSFKEAPDTEKPAPEFFEQTGQGHLLKRWREAEPVVEAAEPQPTDEEINKAVSDWKEQPAQEE